MVEVLFSSHFDRAFRRLSKELQSVATQRKMLFVADPHDPKLHTHKLQGRLQDHWAFSVTRDIRIIFYFSSETRVVFADIGPHDDVY